MGKYYYLVAGLPNLALEGGKPPYTVAGFKEELANHLSKDDMRLLEFLFLKEDNRNLLNQLQRPEFEPETKGKVTVDELNVLINGLQQEIDDTRARIKIVEERNRIKEEHADDFELPPMPALPPRVKPFRNKNKQMPPYFATFTKSYLESVGSEEETVIPWEDRLSSLYYEYAMKRPNAFLASWCELNLNINNIFTALTCRKYKLDRADYIVGDTKTADKLRTSTARDFDLGDGLEYLPDVIRIAEETDWLQREWKTDVLKWGWLDEQLLVKVFDIESVMTYMLKIEMLERWANYDKATGEKVFRQTVGDIKSGCNNTLEEFKRNNKK